MSADEICGHRSAAIQSGTTDKTWFERFDRPAVEISILLTSLILFTAAVLYITFQNDESARTQANQALESTALGLCSAAENVLRNRAPGSDDEMRAIFSDRVVAYALIADKGGKILFHTNRRLAGSNLKESGVGQWLHSGVPVGRRMTLGTGAPAYQYNYAIHRPDGASELLRLVINTTPVDHILARARKMWWTTGFVLLALWVVGISFGRMSVRLMNLREQLNKRRQMALIGQMTSVLAHEIRNALGSIKGYTQLIYEKVPEPETTRAGLEMVLRGSQRIESLVNELLLFSRQEDYRIETLEARSLIDEVLLSAAPLWGGAVEMRIGEGLMVRADRDKLQRVFYNGIQNAIEAMGGEGKIRISARAMGRLVRIEIADSGPGIPEDELRRLFTPFHTTKVNGVGLGLSYSRKVTEGMGGQIELSNRSDGKGAVLAIGLLSGGVEND